MGNQSQNQGSSNATETVRTGAKNSHAAGSGSSTGDPGNQRGQPLQGGNAAKGGQPARQGTNGASPDDPIESHRQDSQNH